MRFMKVDKLPKKNKYHVYVRKGRKDLREFCEEFMQTQYKYALVDFTRHDYCGHRSCYTALYNAFQRFEYPVSVRAINNQVYLVRTDME